VQRFLRVFFPANIVRMNLTALLSAIDSQIARLQQVRTVIADDGQPQKRRGRPPGSKGHKPKAARKKRVLSAEARAKIAEAQRKRWKKVKAL